ncbi:MAG: hypothetical protein KBS74_01015 [Clostridiales bacterium]|nr:hypothetical protein [Candidatus Cacconaster stercorequi]
MSRKTGDLTGERFGNLTVLEKAEGLRDRYYTWHCCCDCGNEIVVNTKNLTAHRTTHCGCRSSELRNAHQKPKDRAGMKYGALTALRMIGKSDEGAFLWKCECGKHIIVPAKQLQRNKAKDCGCGMGEKPKYKDITGQRKGRLTALYPTDKRDGKGSVIWHCKCDCGGEIKLNTRCLQRKTIVLRPPVFISP